MTDPSQPSGGLVDWDAALDFVQGDRELLRDIIVTYLEESARMLVELSEAIADQDGKRMRRAAHTLAGSMRYFGAEAVFNEAAQLEDMGKEGRFDGAESRRDALKTEVERLWVALREYLEQQGWDAG